MNATVRHQTWRDPAALDRLRCPLSHAALRLEQRSLVTVDAVHRYALTASGIPLFGDAACSEDATRQRAHYDEHFAHQYLTNLGYPHTQEYTAYLDRVFVAHVHSNDLADAAEICCGHGELLNLFPATATGVGVDISVPMLEQACQRHHAAGAFLFVQGDAALLPLADAQFNGVFMLGGVHHVSERRRLFKEVFRVLRPGGRFYFREPVSDFVLWRFIRAVVYRISPALDAVTERPLLYRETVPVLQDVGFRLEAWDTYGFLGFCLFMNSDVLVFNRLFRFLPGIRRLTRLFIALDEFTRKVPGLQRAGLQVVGIARKPESL